MARQIRDFLGFYCSGQSLVKIMSVGRKTQGYSPTLCRYSDMRKMSVSAQSRGDPGWAPSELVPTGRFHRTHQSLLSGSKHSDHGGPGLWELKGGLCPNSGLPLVFSGLPASTVHSPRCPHPWVIVLHVSTLAQWYSSSKLRNLLSNCVFSCKIGIINLPHGHAVTGGLRVLGTESGAK